MFITNYIITTFCPVYYKLHQHHILPLASDALLWGSWHNIVHVMLCLVHDITCLVHDFTSCNPPCRRAQAVLALFWYILDSIWQSHQRYSHMRMSCYVSLLSRDLIWRTQKSESGYLQSSIRNSHWQALSCCWCFRHRFQETLICVFSYP